jgi:hypothetical protein
MHTIWRLSSLLALLAGLFPFPTLRAQDSVPPAPTGDFDLYMPVHWRALAYYADADGQLWMAGKDNDFEDYASLFVAKVMDDGSFQHLFSSELPAPAPDNADFALHRMRTFTNGRIELLGTISKHGQVQVDSLIKLTFDLKGKRLERIASPNTHPGKVNNMRFDGADFIICGSVPDPANQTQRPYISICDGRLREKMGETFEPFWEFNDAVRTQDGSLFACGYLPRHGAVFVTLPPGGAWTAAKAGFVEGNAVQILEAGEKVTLLLQSMTTAVQRITPNGTPQWRTDLEGATLSILGNWAYRPGVRLKDGSFLIASAHRKGPQQFIRLNRLSAEGKLTHTQDFGPYQEAKACFVHPLTGGTIRIMAYIRDASDWNLHAIQVDF